ncbi:MAG: phosphogluconate dehydrogenase C-terminal domain-containing protein [Armatimonadota bacterium]|nr:semialdehyde dehydrogenase [bacterium]MDW8319912.1 phosphogluconate dehydrogenase C-terminal domain-containing protein [Armatimonadota bacterium]
MAHIALFGAGGKMGCRITDNLRKTNYTVYYVETGQRGLANLRLRGIEPTPADEALAQAEVAILAIPDLLLESVSAQLVPKMRSGTLTIVLDPAAAYAGVLTTRPDVPLFVTHPCHPPLWNDDPDPEARRDFFGGIKAQQPIVCALAHGTEEDYRRGEEIARTIFAPVSRAHRVTVEQMAILEPAMAETVVACCCTIIREALDEAVRRGVPEEAAWDFMMGHVNIPLAIVFGKVDAQFSDGAKRIIEYGRQRLIQPEWKRLFDVDSVKEQVLHIVRGGE